MIIRNIQIRNNFYALPDGTKSTIGDYCAFGYFDAIAVNNPLKWNYEDSKVSRSIWRYVADSNINNLDGTTTIRNILCFTDYDPVKEIEFWEEAKKHPFIMLTLFRIEAIEERIPLETSVKDGRILYYTSVHSDFVALAWGNNYTECRKKIQSLRKETEPELAILKAFSIISVNEDAGTPLERIEEEKIGCRFRIAVKKNKEPEKGFKNLYPKKLEEKLGVKVDLWYMLGSDDYLLEAKNVSITKLVECYLDGGIMRHEQYKDYAYNIETEILSSESGISK